MTAGRRPVETDRDPGLQPERTRLAWRRTTLSCAVTAVLAGRQVLNGGGASATLAVSLAALVFLAFLWLAHHRMLQLGRPRPALLPASSALGVAACMVALAVFGAAVVW
ncbi:DUF202 domain-containing protein [Actinacidiphila paucisporea]|uniref:DUF202 domain-containing protein n=1 Tax=Actinacidiphila paucisporea TaxID=310782 RepID=A0A1M7P6X3_9ACTN|nr:DUF202 domain-containing protein [Actinacidiphila paucisporea]SHN12402.1 protein of unknown function [Actinacidiphila paucisporea]